MESLGCDDLRGEHGLEKCATPTGAAPRPASDGKFKDPVQEDWNCMDGLPNLQLCGNGERVWSQSDNVIVHG